MTYILNWKFLLNIQFNLQSNHLHCFDLVCELILDGYFDLNEQLLHFSKQLILCRFMNTLSLNETRHTSHSAGTLSWLTVWFARLNLSLKSSPHEKQRYDTQDVDRILVPSSLTMWRLQSSCRTSNSPDSIMSKPDTFALLLVITGWMLFVSRLSTKGIVLVRHVAAKATMLAVCRSFQLTAVTSQWGI